MQIFKCPFCGERDEREFFFAGESGKVRPDTTESITDEQWAAYLYEKRNSKGAVQEIWIHLPCSEVFLLARDSVTMQVTGSHALRKTAS